MQQREEKQLEASVESLISRVAHVKSALHNFIYKLENEYERLTCHSFQRTISPILRASFSFHQLMTHLKSISGQILKPSVLDNFALLSGQLNTINKLLKNEKTPSFRNQVIIPLLLSPDRDEDLAKLTEQRVPVFSHEIVPDYLRTKPDPEVEEQEKQLSADAARIGPEAAQKQIQTLNKLCSNLLEKLNNPRDDRDAESAAIRQNKPSFNPADTNALVGAVAFGKGLSKCRPPGPGAPGHSGQGPMMSGGPTLQQVTIGGGSGQQAGMGGPVAPQQQGQPGKMPSSIKTNIKSASGSMHPYNR
ncbi:mediator of RNA polymerase II transcription subunit 8-like isoform X1 [Micropterus salmoides]|uniref:mediator of RNA polymerase II transcription subunit 8-like isoform X2 n=1 Tax=Micropterus salmoides TaxID=27706 RepID=UPI0018ED1A40|nr:mediator of RNA polymerase II transcription subunit 8-like isoform X2 [Micropterus salmoides]XP_038590725.1 mediator of RNA polymerase II transcription subunit 8-like isoform X1 [Micropterus salmoides]